MSTDPGVIAHILRRITFGPHPGQVETLARSSVKECIDSLLHGPIEIVPTEVVERTSFSGNDELALWWLDRMRQPGNGVHEKLVWYWHGHFTSSLDKAPARFMWRQHHLLRTHALGNFREFVHAVTVDAAMLRYLDGDGSRDDAPNENYARELMELFCLGAGNFAEDDVRAAARVFSGWRVTDDRGTEDSATVSFDAEAAYDRPVTFFGQRRRWDIRSLVDAVVDHPACAPHVARRLWAFYVGTAIDDDRVARLANEFRNANLEIRPLVEAIMHSEEFVTSRHSRARQPIEWLLATLAVTGSTKRKIEYSWVEQLGQLPFRPPNVAGWSLDLRWVSAGQQLLRTSIALGLEIDKAVIDAVAPDVDAVLAHCGVFDASATTRAALDHAIRSQTEYDRGLEMLIALAVASPEFSLA